MPTFTESSITLNFPDNNFFRFADCSGYKSLSGHNFKEMDAGWYDMSTNTYWLFELKDYTLAAIASAQTIEQKSWDMLKKAVDSLMMLLSSKHNYPYASNLDICLPAVPNNSTQFKFITIVHCNASQKTDVQLINESFKRKFKPYASLFNILYYSVVEHSQAIRYIPNSMVQ